MLATPRSKRTVPERRQKTALQKKHQKEGFYEPPSPPSQAKRDSRCQNPLPLLLSRGDLTVSGGCRRFVDGSEPKCLIQRHTRLTSKQFSCALQEEVPRNTGMVVVVRLATYTYRLESQLTKEPIQHLHHSPPSIFLDWLASSSQRPLALVRIVFFFLTPVFAPASFCSPRPGEHC